VALQTGRDYATAWSTSLQTSLWPNRPVCDLVDQSVDYFSYKSVCQDNYSMEYDLPVYASADWST